MFSITSSQDPSQILIVPPHIYNTDNNNNDNSSNTGGKSAAFGAIESIFSSLPKEQQKSIIMDCISPVIMKLSPKWGGAILGVLRNFDVTKLIPLAKDEKELAKTVSEEEKKLENKN